MRWQPILEEFGPNIQHIAGVDNIVDDTLSRLMYTKRQLQDLYKEGSVLRKRVIRNWQGRKNQVYFPITLLIVQIKQQN